MIVARTCATTAIRSLVVGGALMAVAAASPAWAATEIQRVVSPGGVEAWLVEEYAVPIISIQASFRGGQSLETPEQAGLASLFAGMLEEGAGPYDATAFAQRADEVSARMRFDSSRDAVSVGITMLAETRDDALELFRLALTEPRFDAEPLERVKAQIASAIAQQGVDPNSISYELFFETVLPGHPYGRPELGGLETLAALTSDDLRAAAPAFLNLDAIEIGVVGAISAEELAPLLDEVFGALPRSGVVEPERVELASVSGVLVAPYDSPQSTVFFGHSGLFRDDDDFIAAVVMNHILGGGSFTNRLNHEVRETRGLAYSVYSYLAPLDRAGFFLGGVATNNEQVAQSIEVIRAEWRRMAAEGVTAEELEAAQRFITGAYPLRFDSNGSIARILVAVQLAELGIDYIAQRNSLVEAVTVEDIRRVAERLLHEDELLFVVVGQPEGVETDIVGDQASAAE